MKILGAKKGFTLVEMLIVITIVGLLASISISGYTRFRKASVLDLAADNIVATIYDARDSAKFGKIILNSEDAVNVSVADDATDDEDSDDSGEANYTSKCFGVRFTAAGQSDEGDESESMIEKIVSDFSNKKVWNGRWVVEGCKIGDAEVLAPVNLGDLLVLEKIEDVDGGSCGLMFAPPNGDLAESTCKDIIIGYGDEDDDLKRKISIDSKTGKVTVKTLDEEITE